MKNKKEVFALIVQSFIVGLSFLLVKTTLKYTNSVNVLAHRFIFCVIFSSLYMKITKEKPITRNELIAAFPYALLLPILLFTFQTLGLLYISSSEAGLIFALIPIVTLLLSRVFLGEKSSDKQMLFILISVSGTLLNALWAQSSNDNSSILGIILMMLAVLTICIFNVSVRNRKQVQGASTFRFIHTIHLWGGGVFLCIALGYNLINSSILSFIEPFKSAKYFSSIIYLSLLSSLVSANLLTFALQKVKASVVGIFANFSTVLTLLAGILILEEPFFPHYVLTIAMIFIGVLGVSSEA